MSTLLCSVVDPASWHTLSAVRRRVVPRATAGPKAIFPAALETDTRIRGLLQHRKLLHIKKQSLTRSSTASRITGRERSACNHKSSRSLHTPKNCEFKRHIEHGTSFTASSMRALNKVARDVPQNLSTMVPATDTKSIVRTLIVLRELFVESTHYKAWSTACENLDVKHEQVRNPTDLKLHVRTFLKFIATKNGCHACLQLLMVH